MLDRRVLLGNFDELAPSGKHYMPWAMDGVTQCSTCEWRTSCTPGSPCVPPRRDDHADYHCEVCLDGKFVDWLVDEAHRRGLFITSDGPMACEIWVGQVDAKDAAVERKRSIQ